MCSWANTNQLKCEHMTPLISSSPQRFHFGVKNVAQQNQNTTKINEGTSVLIMLCSSCNHK
jgi:hypothetical protein